MALNGRRDLSLAPSPRSGFEMCLLRMLAFRPAEGGAVSASAPAAQRKTGPAAARAALEGDAPAKRRSEEHTSELQSLMRISYAVFCLKKKTKLNRTTN